MVLAPMNTDGMSHVDYAGLTNGACSHPADRFQAQVSAVQRSSELFDASGVAFTKPQPVMVGALRYRNARSTGWSLHPEWLHPGSTARC